MSVPPPYPVPVEPVLLLGVLLLRPGIMFDIVSPRLLAVSRTCSTTRLITLRAAGLRRAATAAPAAPPAAAVATAARFATFLTVRFVFLFAAPLRAARERLAVVMRRLALRFTALFFAPAFFAPPFFDEERFAELRFDDRFFAEDFADRLRDDDFLELLREDEDLFLVAMPFLLMQNGNDGSCVA